MQEKKIVYDAALTTSGCIVDKRDGEILEDGMFISHQESNRRKIHFNEKQKKDEIERFQLKKENEELKNQLGINIPIIKEKMNSQFMWTYFQEQHKLFPDLKSQDISRLVYLSTYCDYNSNILVNNGLPINKKNLNQLMKLDSHTYNSWIDKMLAYKYIEFNGDNAVVNKNFFNRGSLTKKENIKAIRLFIDMIRELYLNLEPKDHHKMGLVLQLIPYMNPHFNCLTLNPHVRNKEKLIPLKLGELADRLGYSQRQCRRLGNEILSIRFGSDRKRMAIAVALDNLKPENHILMFNSKLFFRGNVEEYRLVNSMFDNYQPSELFELNI